MTFFSHRFPVILILMHYSPPAWKRYCPRLCSAMSISQRGLWPRQASKCPVAVAPVDCCNGQIDPCSRLPMVPSLDTGAGFLESCPQTESYWGSSTEGKIFHTMNAQGLLLHQKQRMPPLINFIFLYLNTFVKFYF